MDGTDDKVTSGVGYAAGSSAPAKDSAARQHEPLLETIVQHLPAGVALVEGEELRMRLVNRAYEAYAPGKEMVGSTFEEVWPELDPSVAETLRRVLRTGEPYVASEASYRIARKPGGPLETAWFNWAVYRVQLPGSDRWMLLNTSWEITELKKSKERLLEGEAEFRTLANTVPQLCWMAHADGHIFWYNDRWYEYTGTTPQQMEGWGWQSVHDPSLLPSVLERWKASLKDGTPFEMIFPLRGRDGQFRSFLTRIVPVLSPEGQVVRWIGTNTDVDELRRTQEALRESEARLRLHEERLRLTRTAAKVAAWEYDVENDTFEWSDEVFEMFGSVVVGPKPQHLLSMMKYATDRENATRALKGATSGKRSCQFEFRFARPDGEVRVISARGKPFYNQGHDLLLGMFIDMTPAGGVAVRRQRAHAPARKKLRKPNRRK